MHVSVVLASYCGEQTLPRTLQALSDLDTTGLHVEFLLVDNASTDRTRSLLCAFLEHHAGRCIHEPRPGKSFALNTALDQCQGELIVFTDDDTIPAANWLQAYVAACRAFPHLGFFCGQVRSAWARPPEPWLVELDRTGRSLGATPMDRPDGPVPATDVKGANFAVRAALLADGTRFRTDLGVSSVGVPIAGEETELASRIAARHHRPHYLAAARVQHQVLAHEMSLAWVLRRARRNGRADAVDPTRLPRSRWMLLGIPLYAWQSIIAGTLRGHILCWLGKWTAGVPELIDTHELLGLALQARTRRAST